MRKLKIYLDTSVWNFVFADDAPDKKEITEEFFSEIGDYEIYTSVVVIEEIMQAEPEKRKKLEALLALHKPIVLEGNEEIIRLANRYIEKGVLTSSHENDALHIAYSTFYETDILLSWNYKHLANVFKKRRILGINFEEGYSKQIELITPMEVLRNDRT